MSSRSVASVTSSAATRALGNTIAPPTWLRDALQNSKQLDETIRLLAARESQRSHYRSSSIRPPLKTTSSGRSNSVSSRPLRLGNVILPPPPQIDEPDHYSIRGAASDTNRGVNRYSNIQPYDRNTVNGDGVYRNASWVKETAGGAWWIAAQVSITVLSARSTIIDCGVAIVGTTPTYILRLLCSLCPTTGSESVIAATR